MISSPPSLTVLGIALAMKPVIDEMGISFSPFQPYRRKTSLELVYRIRKVLRFEAERRVLAVWRAVLPDNAAIQEVASIELQTCNAAKLQTSLTL